MGGGIVYVLVAVTLAALLGTRRRVVLVAVLVAVRGAVLVAALVAVLGAVLVAQNLAVTLTLAAIAMLEVYLLELRHCSG